MSNRHRKASVRQVRIPGFDDLWWYWECAAPKCQEWTHAATVSVAPRGNGVAMTWTQAHAHLARHYREFHSVRKHWWRRSA